MLLLISRLLLEYMRLIYQVLHCNLISLETLIASHLIADFVYTQSVQQEALNNLEYHHKANSSLNSRDAVR